MVVAMVVVVVVVDERTYIHVVYSTFLGVIPVGARININYECNDVEILYYNHYASHTHTQ